MLARLRASQLLTLSGRMGLMVGTIHDSLVCDCPREEVEFIGGMLKQAIEEVPSLCKKIWGYNFSLPLKCEVSYGPNKTDMVEYVF